MHTFVVALVDQHSDPSLFVKMTGERMPQVGEEIVINFGDQDAEMKFVDYDGEEGLSPWRGPPEELSGLVESHVGTRLANYRHEGLPVVECQTWSEKDDIWVEDLLHDKLGPPW